MYLTSYRVFFVNMNLLGVSLLAFICMHPESSKAICIVQIDVEPTWFRSACHVGVEWNPITRIFRYQINNFGKHRRYRQ
jgi:hypothetical protein